MPYERATFGYKKKDFGDLDWLGEKANSRNIAFHIVLHSIGEGFGVLGHNQIRGVIRRHKGRRLVIPI